jgi:hypothetical protein
MKRHLLSLLMIAALALGVEAQSINDPFFEKVKYRGAFGSENWLSGWANFDCRNTVYPAPPADSVIGNGDKTAAGGLKITSDRMLDGVYKLDGWVYVQSPATLTIKPGTVIRGTPGSVIVIEAGAKIMAEGTVNSPIVLTSLNDPGNRNNSDWAGLVLCGNAQVNDPAGYRTAEGGIGSKYGKGFGGVNEFINDQNSGVIKYMRIEFPGYDVTGTGNEINGLTLCAVGSGTTIDYVQVSYSGDDSYEWFGGKVNAKHLVAFAGEDDDFDTDYGFQGMIQFGVALRDSSIADQGSDKNRLYESDNDANGSANQPYTAPVFSNISGFGPRLTSTTQMAANHGDATYIRRNSRLKSYNMVLAAWKGGIALDGAKTHTAANQDSVALKYVTIAGSGTYFVTAGAGAPSNWASTDSVRHWFLKPGFHNDTLVSIADLKITNPFNYTNPDFLPMEGSPVLENSSWVKAIEEVEITGESSITSEKGSITLGMNILPSDPLVESYKSVKWEVTEGAELVSLNEETSVLTATSADNGSAVVRLILTRKDDSELVATREISISGQTIELTSIEISGGNSISTDGGTLALTAALLPENHTEGIEWSIKNVTGKASIDQAGLVTAGGTDLSNGTVRVYARAISSEVVDSVDLTLSNQSGADVFVTGITITADGGASEIAGAGSLQLSAGVLPANASIKDVVWSVNNTSVATISSTGLLTAVANGTVTITATAADGSGVTGTLEIVIHAVGIEDAWTRNIRIFPNPAVNEFTVSSEAGLSHITVLNMLGQPVRQIELNGSREVTVDVKDLSKGIYMIQLISSEKEVSVSRIIKK